jgi:phosphoribosylamine--glycine ligase
MNVLVVGSGGREHAICDAIKLSPLCGKLYCAPGNAGIAEVATCLPIGVEKIDEIVAAAKDHKIDFVMIGPENPLCLGLADKLRAAGIKCFGPNQDAAALEGSKGFMKDVVSRAGVSTAEYKRFTDPESAKAYVREKGLPIVIKTDGLAAGKGVTIAHTEAEAFAAIDDAMIKHMFGASGTELVIEEFMEGEEVSFFAISDGKTALPFASAQDHKAVFDGDKGPNTGGMGAYSPAPIFTPEMQVRVMQEMIRPTVDEMARMGCPFTGVLFAGLMITQQGPRLLEYNIRFGDPETQAMLPRLKSDFLQMLIAASEGRLNEIQGDWHDQTALCVVMAANGYPGDYLKGSVIRGLTDANKIPNAHVYHAGTKLNDKGEMTSYGGRVLGVTAMGATAEEAQRIAYEAVDKIDWPGGFCRRDIGWRAIKRQRAA